MRSPFLSICFFAFHVPLPGSKRPSYDIKIGKDPSICLKQQSGAHPTVYLYISVMDGKHSEVKSEISGAIYILNMVCGLIYILWHSTSVVWGTDIYPSPP